MLMALHLLQYLRLVDVWVRFGPCKRLMRMVNVDMASAVSKSRPNKIGKEVTLWSRAGCGLSFSCRYGQVLLSHFYTTKRQRSEGVLCVTFSVAVFVIYLVVLVAIGVITYLRTKSYSDYNLAGRSNNKWVTAISAESSDMSGWLLMGLPGAAYASGFSSIWIIIGLIFGTMFNWIFVANRLRIASESYGAFSITEYFEKRVNDKKALLH